MWTKLRAERGESRRRELAAHGGLALSRGARECAGVGSVPEEDRDAVGECVQRQIRRERPRRGARDSAGTKWNEENTRQQREHDGVQHREPQDDRGVRGNLGGSDSVRAVASQLSPRAQHERNGEHPRQEGDDLPNDGQPPCERLTARHVGGVYRHTSDNRAAEQCCAEQPGWRCWTQMPGLRRSGRFR